MVKHRFFAIRRGGELRKKWRQDGGAWGRSWPPIAANMRLVLSHEGPRCDQDGAKIKPRWGKVGER